MSKRIIPTEFTVYKVLESSARRCCLCFGVNHDYTEKKGQIAHLDHDSSNSVYENLAWLCLSHHDDYDSKSSQTKNYSEYEVKKYRQSLYDEVHRRRISAASGEEEEKVRFKRQFIEENTALFFFAAAALYKPSLRIVLLNEIKDPDFREQIEKAWSFLSQPVPDSDAIPAHTRLDLMAQHISSSKQGKEDLQTLLALAGTYVTGMTEPHRNEALFKIHDDTIRSALMLIRKIHNDKG